MGKVGFVFGWIWGLIMIWVLGLCVDVGVGCVGSGVVLDLGSFEMYVFFFCCGVLNSFCLCLNLVWNYGCV